MDEEDKSMLVIWTILFIYYIIWSIGNGYYHMITILSALFDLIYILYIGFPRAEGASVKLTL